MAISESQHEIIEIYQNSTKIQQFVFVEVFEDLLRETQPKIPKKQLLSSIQDIELWTLEKEMETLPDEGWVAFFEYMGKWLRIPEPWEAIVPFAINKDKTHFSEDVRKHFGYIGEHEEQEIQDYRRIILANLLRLGILKKDKTPMDNLYNREPWWFLDGVVTFDGKGEPISIDMSQIFTRANPSYQEVVSLFPEKRIEEWARLFLKLEFISVAFQIADIEEILLLCTGRDKVQPIPKEEAEFFAKQHKLHFRGQSLNFRLWKPPYILLKNLFSSPRDIGVHLMDLHRLIGQEYPLDKNDYYDWWKQVIEQIVKDINARFRKKFPDIKTFLVTEDSCIKRVI